MITFIALSPRSMEVNLYEEVDSLLEVVKGLHGLIFVFVLVFFSLLMDVIHVLGCIQ